MLVGVNLFCGQQKMKKTNPGVSFADASREIADKWRGMSGACLSVFDIAMIPLFFQLIKILIDVSVIALPANCFFLQLKRKNHMKQKLKLIRNATEISSVTT